MKTITAVLLFSLMLLPGSASAAALYDGSGIYVQAGVDLDADLGVEVDSGATTTDTSDGTDVETTASTSAEVDVTVGGIRAAINVATEADLAAYAESLETSDSNLESASASVDGDVSITYYHPARLFGMVPVRAKSTTVVSVNESGMLETKTTMPWWSFLATGTGSVSSSIDADIANSGEILTDMKLSGNAAARAKVLEAVAQAHARAMVAAASS